MRTWALLVGYREDLQLERRWWHRLFKVIFVLTIAVFGLLAGALAHSLFSPERVVDNTGTLITLEQFLNSSPQDVANVVPGFLALPGTLAERNGDNLDWLYTGDVEQMFCTPDSKRHRKAAEEWMQSGNSDPWAGFETGLNLEQLSGPTCIAKADLKVPTRTNIVKYQFSMSVLSAQWAKTLVAALISSVGLALTLAALYYRGFIYIVCGPRKPKSEVSAV